MEETSGGNLELDTVSPPDTSPTQQTCISNNSPQKASPNRETHLENHPYHRIYEKEESHDSNAIEPTSSSRELQASSPCKDDVLNSPHVDSEVSYPQEPSVIPVNTSPDSPDDAFVSSNEVSPPGTPKDYSVAQCTEVENKSEIEKPKAETNPSPENNLEDGKDVPVIVEDTRNMNTVPGSPTDSPVDLSQGIQLPQLSPNARKKSSAVEEAIEADEDIKLEFYSDEELSGATDQDDNSVAPASDTTDTSVSQNNTESSPAVQQPQLSQTVGQDKESTRDNVIHQTLEDDWPSENTSTKDQPDNDGNEQFERNTLEDEPHYEGDTQPESISKDQPLKDDKQSDSEDEPPHEGDTQSENNLEHHPHNEGVTRSENISPHHEGEKPAESDHSIDEDDMQSEENVLNDQPINEDDMQPEDMEDQSQIEGSNQSKDDALEEETTNDEDPRQNENILQDDRLQPANVDNDKQLDHESDNSNQSADMDSSESDLKDAAEPTADADNESLPGHENDMCDQNQSNDTDLNENNAQQSSNTQDENSSMVFASDDISEDMQKEARPDLAPSEENINTKEEIEKTICNMKTEIATQDLGKQDGVSDPPNDVDSLNDDQEMEHAKLQDEDVTHIEVHDGLVIRDDNTESEDDVESHHEDEELDESAEMHDEDGEEVRDHDASHEEDDDDEALEKVPTETQEGNSSQTEESSAAVSENLPHPPQMFHYKVLVNNVRSFYNDHRYIDVILSCEGREFHGHKVVLASYSTLVDAMLRDCDADSTSPQHLSLETFGIKASSLAVLFDYMYSGHMEPHYLQDEHVKHAAAILGLSQFWVMLTYGEKNATPVRRRSHRKMKQPKRALRPRRQVSYCDNEVDLALVKQERVDEEQQPPGLEAEATASDSPPEVAEEDWDYLPSADDFLAEDDDDNTEPPDIPDEDENAVGMDVERKNKRKNRPQRVIELHGAQYIMHQQPSTGKRKRGRPRKIVIPGDESFSSPSVPKIEGVDGQPPVKRGPGRPRKNSIGPVIPKKKRQVASEAEAAIGRQVDDESLSEGGEGDKEWDKDDDMEEEPRPPRKIKHRRKFLKTPKRVTSDGQRTQTLSARWRQSDGTYKCPICEWTVNNNRNLVTHYMKHTGERPYQCQFCVKAFVQKKHLIEHERTHTGERPFKCEICDARFKSSKHRNRHRFVHTGGSKWQCADCGKMFRGKAGLDCHVLSVHHSIKPFKCTVEGCKYATAHKQSLEQHSRIHTGFKPYQCERCGKTFMWHKSYKVHVSKCQHIDHQEKCEENTRPRCCEECNITFACKKTYMVHNRMKHGYTEHGGYPCRKCGKVFMWRPSRDRHEKKVRHPEDGTDQEVVLPPRQHRRKRVPKVQQQQHQQQSQSQFQPPTSHESLQHPPQQPQQPQVLPASPSLPINMTIESIHQLTTPPLHQQLQHHPQQHPQQQQQQQQIPVHTPPLSSGVQHATSSLYATSQQMGMGLQGPLTLPMSSMMPLTPLHSFLQSQILQSQEQAWAETDL